MLASWKACGVGTTPLKQTRCGAKWSVLLIHPEDPPGRGDLRKGLDFLVWVTSITSLPSSLQGSHVPHSPATHSNSRCSTLPLHLAALGGKPTCFLGFNFPKPTQSPLTLLEEFIEGHTPANNLPTYPIVPPVLISPITPDQFPHPVLIPRPLQCLYPSDVCRLLSWTHLVKQHTLSSFHLSS